MRSLHNLKSTDTGVALDNLVTFQLSPSLSGYDSQRATLFYDSLLERLRSAPGVKAAAYNSVPILAGDEWDSSVSVEGHNPAEGEDMQAFMNGLSPRYFRDDADPDSRRTSPPSRRERSDDVSDRQSQVAEHFFKGRSAIGKRVGWGSGPRSKLTMEIVVVASLYEGPREGVHRQVFIPRWGKDSATFYIRTATESSAPSA